MDVYSQSHQNPTNEFVALFLFQPLSSDCKLLLHNQLSILCSVGVFLVLRPGQKVKSELHSCPQDSELTQSLIAFSSQHRERAFKPPPCMVVAIHQDQERLEARWQSIHSSFIHTPFVQLQLAHVMYSDVHNIILEGEREWERANPHAFQDLSLSLSLSLSASLSLPPSLSPSLPPYPPASHFGSMKLHIMQVLTVLPFPSLPHGI